MAILIVDDENNTREALRTLLSHLGHKVILEAKNGQEALRLLELEKSPSQRIHMIIADWEMPYLNGLELAERIQNQPLLNDIPYLLITSDLQRSDLDRFQKEVSRIDGTLIKPFRMNSLSQAMNSAYLRRRSRRNLILCAGSRYSPFIEQAKELRPSKYWKTLHFLKGSDFSQEKSKSSKSLDALWGEAAWLILDPVEFKDEGSVRQLASIKRENPETPFVCTSRDPEEVFPLRTLCDFFLESAGSIQAWIDLFGKIESRIRSAWTLGLSFQEARLLYQQKEFKKSENVLLDLKKLDPHQPILHMALGDVQRELGRKPEATASYEAALAINPCLPGAYIKCIEMLMEGETKRDSAYLEHISEESIRFCPRNSEVLLAASDAFKRLGRMDRSREVLNKILSFEPSHAQARKLLVSL